MPILEYAQVVMEKDFFLDQHILKGVEHTGFS